MYINNLKWKRVILQEPTCLYGHCTYKPVHILLRNCDHIFIVVLFYVLATVPLKRNVTLARTSKVQPLNWVKGHGTCLIHKYSSHKKSDEYLQMGWVPHPFIYRLQFPNVIECDIMFK